VIDQLKQFGETRRGWLGVRIQQVTDEIAESLKISPPRGALVAGVDDKGPAKARRDRTGRRHHQVRRQGHQGDA
jgi:S1-C subfamily serine protease